MTYWGVIKQVKNAGIARPYFGANYKINWSSVHVCVTCHFKVNFKVSEDAYLHNYILNIDKTAANSRQAIFTPLYKQQSFQLQNKFNTRTKGNKLCSCYGVRPLLYKNITVLNIRLANSYVHTV